MASNIQTYCYEGSESFVLSKWKIKIGNQLFYNSVILSYKEIDSKSTEGKEPLLKYKSNAIGTVLELLVSEGETITSGKQLLKIQPCTHPIIMKDLCAECGTDLRQLDRENFQKLTAATTFSMVHVVPELKVNLEQAEKLGKDDETRLLERKKLVLLVDLDQTLIHTTNDNVPQDLLGVHHFQLYGPHSPWYHTKLRPGTDVFLQNISQFYELHICTFGARLYAHKIAKILDPDGKFFSHRILSRDECFDPTSKMGNLKALFPRGDHMVCIIDDREDVWNFAPNVIHVKPYSYFRNTGDINAPPSVVTSKETPQSNVKCELQQNVTSSNTTSKEKCEKSITQECEDTTADVLETLLNTIAGNVLNSNILLSDNKSISSTHAETNKLDIVFQDNSGVGNSKTNLRKHTLDCKQNIETVDVGSGKHEHLSKDISENKKCENSNTTSQKTCSDDYLLYLEEILINVHKTYYKQYNKLKQKQKKSIPDLKSVIPSLRSKVLKGVHIVFSSIIPTNCVPEKHHLWTLAESLGAEVSRELILQTTARRTTHVVATKWGTAKVNAAKKHGNIHLVQLDWLLCCAERWEYAEEKLFYLPKDPFLDNDNGNEQTSNKTGGKLPRTKRPHSPMYKSSKDDSNDSMQEEKFSERIFVEAGLSLSQEDIDDMDREIDEACSEESVHDSESSSSDSSSVESLSSGDYPKGWRKRRKHDVVTPEIIEISGSSSDAETIGSVDEEMEEAVKNEFGSM